MTIGSIVCILYFSSAFVLQLAFDPATFQPTGSPVFQVANAFCALFVLFGVFRYGEVRRAISSNALLAALLSIGFVSVLWSLNRTETIRTSVTVAANILSGVVMAAALTPSGSLRLVVRTLTALCLLSIVFVIAEPTLAVHQASDPIQSQHAGLWRGIFTHKQGLGLISGFSLGATMYFGRYLFGSALFAIASFAINLACLLGSESSTGFVFALLMPLTLVLAKVIAGQNRATANLSIMFAIVAGIVVLASFHYGVLDTLFVDIMGKSADLTGRADAWPWVMKNINGSGMSLLGGGLGGGWEGDVAPGISIDNGYIDLLIAFGYVGAVLVVLVHLAVLGRGAQLLQVRDRPIEPIDLFPFSFILVLFIINVTEPTMMAKNVFSLLTGVALFQTTRSQSRDAAVRSRFGARTVPLGGLG